MDDGPFDGAWVARVFGPSVGWTNIWVGLHELGADGDCVGKGKMLDTYVGAEVGW
jgi:hypothetical protein